MRTHRGPLECAVRRTGADVANLQIPSCPLLAEYAQVAQAQTSKGHRNSARDDRYHAVARARVCRLTLLHTRAHASRVRVQVAALLSRLVLSRLLRRRPGGGRRDSPSRRRFFRRRSSRIRFSRGRLIRGRLFRGRLFRGRLFRGRTLRRRFALAQEIHRIDHGITRVSRVFLTGTLVIYLVPRTDTLQLHLCAKNRARSKIPFQDQGGAERA